MALKTPQAIPTVPLPPAPEPEPAQPDRAPSVSFIVTARNQAATIGQTLDSILLQAGLGEYEVLVVDNGSADGTSGIVHELSRTHPQIRLLALEPRQGSGFARLHGMVHSRHALIASIDADIVLPPGWLSRCLVELHFADAVCGTAVPDEDLVFLQSRFGLEPRLDFRGPNEFVSNALYRRDVLDTPWLDTCLLSSREFELVYELERRGLCLRSVTGLRVEHRSDRSLGQACASMVSNGHRSTCRMIRYGRFESSDLAFAGWLLAVVGAGVARRRGAEHVLLRPGAYTAALAAFHVKRAFRYEPARAPGFAAAMLADGLMLSLYFVGRLLGVTRLRTTQRPERHNSAYQPRSATYQPRSSSSRAA